MKDKVYRHQMDNCQDEVALACGISCSADEDKTRQEFVDETNINFMVARAGGGVPMGQPPVWGADVNYDLNLQDALEAVAAARQAWARQPESVRSRFNGFPDLYDAVASGRVSLTALDTPATPAASQPEPAKPAVS